MEQLDNVRTEESFKVRSKLRINCWKTSSLKHLCLDILPMMNLTITKDNTRVYARFLFGWLIFAVVVDWTSK